LRKPPQTLDKSAFHAFVNMVQARNCISNARKGDNVAVEQFHVAGIGEDARDACSQSMKAGYIAVR
jgi:hypothetical protein